MPTILLVHNDPPVRAMLGIVLPRAGYTFYVAEDGLKGIKLLETITPDLIIVDLAMVGMDGFELCRYLRANAKTAHTPIIMLTAHAADAMEKEGLASGANLYLTLPIPPRELIPHIEELLTGDTQQEQ